MASGHNNSSKKKGSVGRLSVGSNSSGATVGGRSRSGSQDVTTTADSSPSDEHYELASDQLLLDTLPVVGTSGTIDALTEDGRPRSGGGSEEEEKEGEDRKGKEAEEVNLNCAFALDILGRKTGKKPPQLTGFRNEMYQLDLRSDSEDESPQIVENGEQEGRRTKSLDRNLDSSALKRPDSGLKRSDSGLKRSDSVLKRSDSGQSSPEQVAMKNVQIGPLDTRLRTAEEKRRALELAFQANEQARCFHYDEAVRLLTQAILINENDYRFFVNRSYCYDCLGNLNAALEDADRAILLNSEWPKGYFRKGRAQSGLCLFKEAERSFLKVIHLDPDAEEEVIPQLTFIRFKALSILGINPQLSSLIASKFDRLAPALSFALKSTLKYCLEDETTSGGTNVQDIGGPSFQQIGTSNQTVLGLGSGQGFPGQSVSQGFPGHLAQRKSLGGTPIDDLIDQPIGDASLSPLPSFGIILDTPLNETLDIDRHFDLDRKLQLGQGLGITLEKPLPDQRDDLLSDSESYHGPPSPTPSLPIRLPSHFSHSATCDHSNTTRTDTEISSPSPSSSLGPSIMRTGMVDVTNRVGRSVSDAGTSESMTCTDVTNPFKWKALWVGNLSSCCSEKSLRTMFGRFGQLSYCTMYPVEKKPGTAFALVHYDNPDSPSKAMTEYQGVVLKGVSAHNSDPLVIRFRPSKEQKRKAGGTPGKELPPASSGGTVRKISSEKVPLQECYYWRTTGCRRGSECIYSHVEKHKGVDFQPWMTGCDRHLLSKQGSKASGSGGKGNKK